MPKGTPIEEEKEKLICEMYTKEKLSTRQIASKLSFGQSSIVGVLKRNNIDGRSVYKLSNEQKEEVCKLYQEGVPISILSDRFGIHKVNITGILNRRGIPTSRENDFGRLYHIDHNAFSSPLSNEAKYWLGFIVGDGNVYHGVDGKTYRLTISLQKRDLGHLDKLKNFLKSDSPITVNENKGSDGMVTLAVNSKQILGDLKEYGVLPNKTFKAEVPDGLENCRDFWRGLVDADGSVLINKGLPYISLCGNENVIIKFKKHASKVVVTGNRIRPIYSSYYFTINSKKAVPLIKHLYEGCNVYLDRKYQTSMSILDTDWTIKRNRSTRYWEGGSNPKAKLTEIDVIDILNSDKSLSELSSTYNVSKCTIHDILKRRTWKHISI